MYWLGDESVERRPGLPIAEGSEAGPAPRGNLTDPNKPSVIGGFPYDYKITCFGQIDGLFV